MRDATFMHFVKDYNLFKRAMDEHLVTTDFRDFETYMYTRALYNLLIKIPLFKIFFNHELSKIAKKRRAAQKARAAIEKAHRDQQQEKQKVAEYAEKIKI